MTREEVLQIVRSEMRHNDLMDMPQGGSVNRDHDGRYHRKHAHIYMDHGNHMYVGDAGSNGSVRQRISSDEYVIEKRISGVWTAGIRITFPT